MDERDFEQPDRAECPACNGTGNQTVIMGDDEQGAPCEDCGGTGRQLTRDEFAALPDLRLVPEAVEQPWDATGFSSHGEEVQAAMRELDRTRRAS